MECSGANREVQATVVFVGITSSLADSIATSVGLRSRVVVDSQNELRTLLGGIALPSTKLAVSPTREIMLLDARYTYASCQWSIEAQYAQLRGLNSARAIRFRNDALIQSQ